MTEAELFLSWLSKRHPLSDFFERVEGVIASWIGRKDDVKRNERLRNSLLIAAVARQLSLEELTGGVALSEDRVKEIAHTGGIDVESAISALVMIRDMWKVRLSVKRNLGVDLHGHA